MLHESPGQYYYARESTSCARGESESADLLRECVPYVPTHTRNNAYIHIRTQIYIRGRASLRASPVPFCRVLCISIQVRGALVPRLSLAAFGPYVIGSRNYPVASERAASVSFLSANASELCAVFAFFLFLAAVSPSSLWVWKFCRSSRFGLKVVGTEGVLCWVIGDRLRRLIGVRF